MTTKPKIDLKARLGRRPGATPASASIPPPVGVQTPQSGAPIGQPPQAVYQSSQPQARPGAFDGLGVASVQAPPAPMLRSAAPMISTDMEAELQAVQRGGRGKVM